MDGVVHCSHLGQKGRKINRGGRGDGGGGLASRCKIGLGSLSRHHKGRVKVVV